ncbi:hypothetical protein G7Z17_g5999 [Cylindrodendrum hubeiense]|uniref:Homeobox domain-containing protein n=1 Tax=Cylindrodendrum hubeiense TaxID=595255 RepID=A0A9P5L8M0_9HYPO|nr:hypothetical protein G7Z17_g5999 [Cylindrodendrum hubeiense]
MLATPAVAIEDKHDATSPSNSDTDQRSRQKETQPQDQTPTATPTALCSTQEETYPEGGLRAWLVVLGAWLAAFSGMGLSNSMATIHAYISTHQLADYSEGAIGWIFSVYVFLGFFCGIYVGPLQDTYGPRWLILGGTVCVVTALMLLSFCVEYWHFMLSFGVLNGIGASLLFTPSITTVGHWFQQRRGLATGISSTGGAFSGMIYPLVLRPLFENVGWAWAIRTIGFISLVACGAACLLIRTRLPPSSKVNPHPDIRIFRHAAFAFTTIGIFLLECALFVPLTYISSYAIHEGFGVDFSYQLPTILNAASILGRVLPGWWGDSFGVFNSNILTVALSAVACLAVWLPVGSSTAGLVVFVALFGFASGNNIKDPQIMTEQRMSLNNTTDDTSDLVPGIDTSYSTLYSTSATDPIQDWDLAQNFGHDGFSHETLQRNEAENTSIVMALPSSSPWEDLGQPLVGAAPLEKLENATTTVPAKVVNRLDSGSVRTLRQWFAAHDRHPYATAKDVEILQSKTGLTKLQVTNWLANTRRRSKFQPPASSPVVRGRTERTSNEQAPIDIPARTATPMPLENMNPLERWKSSPPEHEAADVSDISRAVAASSASPHTVCQERVLEERTFYRKDHLQQHLKTGSTMADWKGDWGFDPQVVETIDNAMPPYLINYEQHSAFPISVLEEPADTPTSPYELIKLELEYFMREHLDKNGHLPSDRVLQYESCCIIFGADVMSDHPASSAPSWLRDVFMSSDISKEARLRPMQQVTKARMSQLKINGKGSIFDNCELEIELCRLVTMNRALNQTMSDYELQQEASNILVCIEAFSPNPSKHFIDFLLRLVWGSNEWLGPLRQREQHLVTDETANQGLSQLDSTHVDLASDGEMGRGVGPSSEQSSSVLTSTLASSGHSFSSGKTPYGMPFLLNDHNSYRRLTSGLTRFVANTMSPNNPNSHVPTDEELQYQARWIWYDE